MFLPRSRRSGGDAVRQRLARILRPDLSPPPAMPATPGTTAQRQDFLEATLSATPSGSSHPTETTGAAETTDPARSADGAETVESAATGTDTGSRGSSEVAGRLAQAFGVDGARVDPGRRGLRSLVVVATAVLLLAAGLAWWSKPRPEPIPVAEPATPVAHPSAPAEQVVAAVAGKVRRPGLVTLASGSRVADAITAAGGLLPGTDIGYLNLARKVADGELIVVGATPPPGAPPGVGTGPGEIGAPGGKVNLNTATLPQLDGLPGVGPVLAQRILSFRDEHGTFRSVADLRRVDGIGPARYEQLKDLVTV